MFDHQPFRVFNFVIGVPASIFTEAFKQISKLKSKGLSPIGGDKQTVLDKSILSPFSISRIA